MQALVGHRAVLDAVVVVELSRADLEAPLAKLVHAAHPLGRVVAHPILDCQLVEPRERRARCDQARAELLGLLLRAVLPHAETAQERRQREALSERASRGSPRR